MREINYHICNKNFDKIDSLVYKIISYGNNAGKNVTVVLENSNKQTITLKPTSLYNSFLLYKVLKTNVPNFNINTVLLIKEKESTNETRSNELRKTTIQENTMAKTKNIFVRSASTSDKEKEIGNARNISSTRTTKSRKRRITNRRRGTAISKFKLSKNRTNRKRASSNDKRVKSTNQRKIK